MIRKTTIVILAMLLGACGTIVVDLPPVAESPTGIHDTGRVIWHDLLTTTPAASRKFYGELFGWTFEKPGIHLGLGGDEDYMLIRHNGRLIGGMLDANVLGHEENVSQWITMISVADIDAAVARVEESGGQVLTRPTDLKSRGSLAVLEDPTGALFAMIQARGGDPEVYKAEMDGFLWDELWTNDRARATDFYTNVFGYETQEIPPEVQGEYHALGKGGDPRVGVIDNPFKDERPVWVNYLRVTDPAAITARVEGLGGNILVEAQARGIGGQVAFVAGPSGAGIALQTWPPSTEEGE